MSDRFRRGVPILALALVVAACVKAPTTGKAAPKATATPAKSAMPTSPAVASSVLQPLKTPSVAFSGRIAIDAPYAVAANAAKVISNNGGGVISNNGGGVLSMTGAPILSNNSGNLIDHEYAGIIGHNGAGLSSADGFLDVQGAPLIGNNGGGLLSNNGGNVISNNGGGIVSNNSGSYALLDDSPPHGSLPAAGMLVAVKSLADGAFVPLGLDGQGKPVYAIYTDARGNFKVTLPKAVSGNLIVMAAAPGAKDGRLAVDDVVAAGDAAGLAVDDGTAVVTTYLRGNIADRLEQQLDPDLCNPPIGQDDTLATSFQAVVDGFADQLQSDAFTRLPRDAKARVLGRLADVALGHLKLATEPINDLVKKKSTASGPALPVLVDFLAKVNQAAATKLAASPRFFDDRPYFRLANQVHATPYTIQKPADVSEFIVKEYLTSNDSSAASHAAAVLVDLGLEPAVLDDVKAAALSLFAAGAGYLTDAQWKPAAAAALKGAIAAETATQATPGACKPTPAPPTSTAVVTTLPVDGKMYAPFGIVADAQGFLYVSDSTIHAIYRIALKKPQALVKAGGPRDPAATGTADGPGGDAYFNSPSGLAIDAAGNVYIADTGNNRIRKMTPDFVVSTVAGSGDAASVDGQGAMASFNRPQGLAIAPDNTLYVAEVEGGKVRRIDPAGNVTTLVSSTGNVPFRMATGLLVQPDGSLVVADAGNHLVGIATATGATYPLAGNDSVKAFRDGTLYTAIFDHPSSMVRGPDGTIYVADGKHNRIRMITPDGLVGTLAGSGQACGADGVGTAASFNSPEGLALGPDGKLYVADRENGAIRVIQLPKN